MADTRAQQTRDKILRAAHDEFSERGPAGARIDRIAMAAGVNKQRMYAYFTNKEGMFSAVLSRAFADLAAAVPIPATLEGLLGYAGEVFDYHRKDPSLVRLLAWEGLQYRTDALDTPYSREAYYQGTMSNLARSTGADIEQVARTLLVIVGIASWPHIVPQQRRLFLARRNPETKRELDLLREAVVASGRACALLLVQDEAPANLPTN
jgi:AcrR family transcriptional regulator